MSSLTPRGMTIPPPSSQHLLQTPNLLTTRRFCLKRVSYTISWLPSISRTSKMLLSACRGTWRTPLMSRRRKVGTMSLGGASFWHWYLAFMSASNCRIVGASSRIFLKFKLVEHLISCRVSQDLGLCRPSPANSNLTLTFPRFAFSGGSNVTLEGSTDPHWGWVNSYGQQVESKILISRDRVLTHWILSVVERCISGEPPFRVGFRGHHEWGDQGHEVVASECWRELSVLLLTEVLKSFRH